VPEKQFYKCFSCGAGGDAFSFVMDYHKMAFPEAKRFLAERANIELTDRPETTTEGPSARQRIAEANHRAARFFARQLADEKTGAAARSYLQSRGFNDQIIQQFNLGYAPDQWDALAGKISSGKAPVQDFIDAGLIGPRSNGPGHYDRFRHRLMFPIQDVIGRVVAFGGRVLEGSDREEKVDAKYLNSPESSLFNKSATLYGLNHAHRAIAETRTAVVVEGYTDVLAAHQHGMHNVVATLGTALTADHARILRRYCDRVLLVFDADEAGQKAADRALEVFFTERVDIGIVVLPDDADPAELLGRIDGADQWQQALGAAEDAMSYHHRRLRTAYDNDSTLAGRQRLTEAFLQKLVGLGLQQMDRLRYGQVFARLAELLGMSPSAVADTVRAISKTRPKNVSADDVPAEVELQSDPAEESVIGCLLNQPHLFHQTMADGRELNELLVAEDFQDPRCRQLYRTLHDWFCDQQTDRSPDLRALLDDESLVRFGMNTQTRVHQMVQGDSDGMSQQLAAHGQALIGRRQKREYEQQKRQMREQPDPGDELQRLALAIAHKNANPSAVVRPKTVR
ncbi:MAG: DNA primase, partial [Phycisphaeraceae bacterium]|nr:DNA primase [Phycisphaeraceae bacterium]